MKNFWVFAKKKHVFFYNFHRKYKNIVDNQTNLRDSALELILDNSTILRDSALELIVDN